MALYQYLLLTPESLIVSMLNPAEFGSYMAVGTENRCSGQALFFSLKDGYDGQDLGLAEARKKCTAHEDGSPKHSVYASVYRVIERVPLDALDSLYLVTAHGRTLKLQSGRADATKEWKYHLYRELAPLHPLVASTLGAEDFISFITDKDNPIFVPKICIVELELSGLAFDPGRGNGENLPYKNVGHLRSCLLDAAHKRIKTVDRLPQQSLMYRCIKGGIHIGDNKRVISFPFPSIDHLQLYHDAWWKCANDSELVWSI